MQLKETKINSLPALIEDVKNQPYFKIFVEALAKERSMNNESKTQDIQSKENDPKTLPASSKPIKRKRGRPRKSEKLTVVESGMPHKITSQRIAENIKKRALEKMAAELAEVKDDDYDETLLSRMAGPRKKRKRKFDCEKSLKELKADNSVSELIKNESLRDRESSNNIIQAIVSAVMIKSNTLNSQEANSSGSKTNFKLHKKKPKIGTVEKTDGRPPSGVVVKSLRVPRYKYDTGRDEDRPYPCEYCPGRFTKSSYLKQHVRTHTGERPHSCRVCGKTFRELAALRRHGRTHTGEKPFVCKECGKRYADRAVLVEHSRVHSGEKPFLCDFCSKPFAYKFSFKQHMKRHMGDRDHLCNSCDAKFYTAACLNAHVKKNHSDQSSSSAIAIKNREKIQRSLLSDSSSRVSDIGNKSVGSSCPVEEDESDVQRSDRSLVSSDVPFPPRIDASNCREKYHAGEMSSEYLTDGSHRELDSQRYVQESSRYFLEQQKFQAEFQKIQNEKSQQATKYMQGSAAHIVSQKFGHHDPSPVHRASSSKVQIPTSQQIQMEPENLQKNSFGSRSHLTHHSHSVHQVHSDDLRNEQLRSIPQEQKYFQDPHKYIQEIRKYQEPQRYLQELRKFQEAQQHGQQHHQQQHQIVTSGPGSFRYLFSIIFR